MPSIKTVGIISKPKISGAAEIVCSLLSWLNERQVVTLCDEQTALYANLPKCLTREDLADKVEMLIVLGGDGTLLSAARVVACHNVPLFAVNLGNLGFLTAIQVPDLYSELELALEGKHPIAKRAMVDCEVLRDGQHIASYCALNDVVITKSELARVIDLETYVNDHYVAACKADGMIISTPTGSTAYSLSAGGPIIYPSVRAFCITPICPHMLTYRPVLVPDSAEIRIVNHGADGTYLTIDGQVGEPLRKGDVVLCRASPNSIQLIRPPKSLFFDVLREKLKWGER